MKVKCPFVQKSFFKPHPLDPPLASSCAHSSTFFQSAQTCAPIEINLFLRWHPLMPAFCNMLLYSETHVGWLSLP